MKPTIKDVALAAKVSVGTVSRYLNNDPTVAQEKRQRILLAIQELDYVPRRKISKLNYEMPLHNKTIALAMLGMDRSLVSLPVVAEAIHGAETAIARVGGTMLLANAPDLDMLPPVLMRSKLDGIILKGALQGNAISKKLAPLADRLLNVPLVWLLGRPEGCDGDIVGANDLQAGEIAADYLFGRGHAQLAFLNPKRDHVTFNRRRVGFNARAEALGASVSEFQNEDSGEWKLPLESVHDVSQIKALVDKLLANSPSCTAVFVPADSIAALVYRELTSRSLILAKDISLISCNNEYTIISGLHPAVTTIDTHAQMIGDMAVEQLIWRMKNPDKPSVETLVEPILIERESVAKLS